MSRAPAVFNIPPGQSFVDALAQGIVDRAGDGERGLSDCLVLLPNRRAARILREAFLRLTKGRAILLPRMQPLGDLDADDILLRGLDDAIPPAIPRVERQILLARLILQAGTLARSFDQAAAIAGELATLLDQMQTEGIGFDRLGHIVPDAFSGHWQATLEFLKILTHHWPAILAEKGVIDPADRRNRLLVAQAALWQEKPPAGTVIAAGSTGSVPAAADLLRAVARLPNGFLVLPGLDAGLDDAGWAAVGEDHPQFNLKRLIEGLGTDRRDIPLWSETPAPLAPAGRVRLLSESLRPADTTGAWQNLGGAGITIAGLSRIDCANAGEEASVIALLLRRALVSPGKTAALITPDRNLARRVTAALGRWGIVPDDSAGQLLSETAHGLWFDLVARMAVQAFAPLPVLSCLKNPLSGLDPALIARLETKGVLRGSRPAPGLAGITEALAATKDAQLALDISPLLARIEHATRDFTALLVKGSAPFARLLQAHVAMAEHLAREGARGLWRGEAGEALSLLINETHRFSRQVPDLSGEEYLALMRGFMKNVTIRRAAGAHPRVSILGQIEARLFQPDIVVLGGLNEGSWPALPPQDPWMSRPMRAAVGLPSPERSIGLSAHDFMQAALAGEVFMTRAAKEGGTPAVPARWLLRMDAVLSCAGISLPARPALELRQWAAAMDQPAAITPCQRPQPCPPLSARPREMSVTAVERWRRDPYEIYARAILNLRALDPIDDDPGAARRGEILHHIFERFIDQTGEGLPPDALDLLIQTGRRIFDEAILPPEVKAFWWAKFEHLAPAFIQEEREWRDSGARPLAVELRGRVEIDGFTLTAKADRIDRLPDGTLAVLDYKTGGVPTGKDVEQGFSPQLPLEAVIARDGGFAGIPPANCAALAYIKLSGPARNPCETILLKKPEDLAAAARDDLARQIAAYKDPAMPYTARPRPDKAPRYSDYGHLARLGEWSSGGEDDEGETAA